jgi:hypothetical protein
MCPIQKPGCENGKLNINIEKSTEAIFTDGRKCLE